MNDTLERQIFGGSDSELSSEAEDIPRQRIPRRSPPIGTRQDIPESDAEDDYREEPRGLPSFKKKKHPSTRDEVPRPAPRRKKSRKVSEEAAPEQLPELNPEEEKRAQLNARIDAAAKTTKARGKKRKKNADEDVLDQAADDEVIRVKQAMEQAALADQEENKAGRAALAKLVLLPEVTEILQKTSLTQSIIDQNFLEAVRLWLEPLSDKSLPALNIQRAFFEILGKMFIDTNTLKDSGLGRIVLFYTKKNKRVSPAIKAQADNLISQWSRPILKRSASYRDRDIPIAERDRTKRTNIKLSAILEQGRKEDAGRIRKHAVRIPERTLASFTVVPRSNVGANGPGGAQAQVELERRKAQQDRLRKVQRKLEVAKQRTARM